MIRADVQFSSSRTECAYVGEPFERAVADQTEFLMRELAPALR